MLCPHCGGYVTAEEIVCPKCGTPTDTAQEEVTGVAAIRQGRRARMAKAANESPVPRRVRRGASRAFVEEETAADDDVPLYGSDDGIVQSDSVHFRGRDIERAPRKSIYYGRLATDVVKMPGSEQEKRREWKIWKLRIVRKQPARKKNKPAKEWKTYDVRRHAINWSIAAVAGACAVVMLIVGFFVYLNNTASGQRMLVRWGREASSVAVWEVGEEEMNVGNIEDAIMYFEMARELEGEEEENVDGLLLLGSAYEAAGRIADAEELYTHMYTKTVPTRSEPYANVIRIMRADGRDAEAAELMLLAYDKTGQNTFLQQRSAMLPQAPTIDLIPGLYPEAKMVKLTSLQGYDVYYTFEEDAVLPDEGIKVDGPFLLDEGIYAMRAVAVNGHLVSDEMKGTYKIILPSPQSPKATLAPNTYSKRQTVKLRLGEENKNDTDITIYYTIDGSIPDADSPIFTGEAIVLPTGGYVKLKAIAVNSYNKVSNVLEVTYKIDCGPYPESSWTSAEGIGDMALYTTTLNEFRETYGEPKATEEWWVVELNAFGQKLSYDWGYAVVGPKGKQTVLVELFFTDGTFKAPRSTGVGSSENDIVSAFRDMQQITSPSGNRGLYSNSNGTGKIFVVEDGKEIRYTTPSADSHTWCMTYSLDKNGVCRSVHWYFEY